MLPSILLSINKRCKFKRNRASFGENIGEGRAWIGVKHGIKPWTLEESVTMKKTHIDVSVAALRKDKKGNKRCRSELTQSFGRFCTCQRKTE